MYNEKLVLPNYEGLWVCLQWGCHPTPLKRALGSIQTAIWSFWRLLSKPVEGYCWRLYVWQQGSVPCPTFRKSQKCSLTSPAPVPGLLIPLIVIPWITLLYMVKKGINHFACNTKTELVAKIKEVFEDLFRNTVWNTCIRFLRRSWLLSPSHNLVKYFFF